MQTNSKTATAPGPYVLAICVNRNGQGVLEGALQGLISSPYPNLRIVVVDCASQDGSESLVPPSVTLLSLNHNPGYAGALNIALKRTQQFGGTGAEFGKPDYFLFMINDVEMPSSLIDELVRFTSNRSPCVCGPQVLIHSTPDRMESSQGKLSWSHVLARFEDRNRLLSFKRPPLPYRTELLLGCALFVDSQALEVTGLWDETFFMYHEEVDWLYRCGQQGVAIYHCPFLRISHHGGIATKKYPLKKIYWLRRNTVYFFKKHGAGPKQWIFWATTLTISLILNLVTFRWKRLATICRGVFDGFRLEEFHSRS